MTGLLKIRRVFDMIKPVFFQIPEESRITKGCIQIVQRSEKNHCDHDGAGPGRHHRRKDLQ